MKIICVPKDTEALHRLDYNHNISGDLLEVNLDDKDFEKLWQSDFFTSINVLTNSIIDIFEDEHIVEAEKLKNVINSDLFENGKYHENIFKIVGEIEELFKEALQRKTGIHFYF
jgi:hypothetical protein